MTIEEIITKIRNCADCSVKESSGLPVLNSKIDELPDDLMRFYSICGGAELFMSQDFGFKIVSANDLKPANSVLRKALYENNKAAFDNDISSHWYLLFSSVGPEENIVIDLHPERLGQCYDGYVSDYATCDTKIVAASFSEALERLLDTKGEYLWWDRIGHSGFIYSQLSIAPPCG